uniref:DUF3300 domain-containing protein n=1 Tax=Candidatus Kentrum sp. TUN TaxID=2126343 RepID=A0A450ZIC8_9GAMM|nr:MAG: hypothetical protein BECKTUN1418F_GA0071002_10228 [Candidatus Kentron sp. TUN]VFK54427.1 MAG: hypothetical protein BECKTUN1418D_GA0071000_10232 [Candidatus Kentron sp. TUN]VFK54817.1 MAG: hypothetical protein BECKTUN1418E_GA0071001_10238 [Candidatus Kentron sp. TUN]
MRISNSIPTSRIRRTIRPSPEFSSNLSTYRKNKNPDRTHARGKANPLSASARSADMFFLVILFTLFLAGVSGCSNQYAEDATRKAEAVGKRLTELGRRIDSGSLVNTRVIKTYADRLASRQPAFKEIAMQLRLDGTTKGPLYRGLRQRLADVNRKPGNKQEFAAAYQELEALEAGTDPIVYNDALLDVVNTLADLSQGELPRINIPENVQTAAVKGGSGQVPGSYLVGNPGYGQWKTDSSGTSFWQWYGMYRMFGDVLGFAGGGFGGYHRGPIYHDAWYSRPRYSFYHDAGRNTYGSRADRNTWRTGRDRLARQGIRTPRPKNYGSVASKQRVSTYASRRARTNSALRSGRMPSSSNTRTSATRARMGTNVKRRSSFFGASSRGTSSSRSRRFRGK